MRPMTPEEQQGYINLMVGAMLELLPLIPAKDDTIQARIEAELQRINVVEQTVRRWWGLEAYQENES